MPPSLIVYTIQSVAYCFFRYIHVRWLRDKSRIRIGMRGGGRGEGRGWEREGRSGMETKRDWGDGKVGERGAREIGVRERGARDRGEGGGG